MLKTQKRWHFRFFGLGRNLPYTEGVTGSKPVAPIDHHAEYRSYGKKLAQDKLSFQHLCFAVSSDGRSLLCGSPDGSVRLWDILTGTELAAFHGHASAVNAVAFSPLGKTVASVSNDCTGLIWNITKVRWPAPPAKALSVGDLDQCWQALADRDAQKAFAAIRDLTGAAEQAVALLQERLKPPGRSTGSGSRN